MSTAIEKIVEELLEKSEALLVHINQGAEGQDYEDAYIEKIQLLLDARQEVIDRLQTMGELKTLIEKTIPEDIRARVIKIDQAINSGLKKIFGHIQQNRRLFQAKQRSRKQYRNPYSSIPSDGMFVDKRK